MRSVLFVSKPVAPPWNDSNKNLVRALAKGIERYEPTILVPAGQPQPFARSEPIYQSGGGYAPALRSNARVFQRLLLGPRADIWHFFFGPNPRTLRAGRVARWLRRIPCIHTIASAPDNLESLAPLLFADKIVVLSAHTQSRLAKAGRDSSVIRPAIEPLEVDADRIERAKSKYGLQRPYVLYPGDLEFGNGAETFIKSAALASELQWVIAARPKTAGAVEAKARLQQQTEKLGANIVWLGEIDDIHAVVAGASAVTLLSDTLHAKMDWPLVILEALMCRVGCVIASAGSVAELAPSDGCVQVMAGSAQDLLEAVRKIHRSWTDRQKEHARQWVIDQCAPSQIARAYETLYDSVLDGQ